MTDKDRFRDRIRYEPTIGFLVLVLKIKQMSKLVTEITGFSMEGAAQKTWGRKNRPGCALPLESEHTHQETGGQLLSLTHQQAMAWMRCVGHLF